MMVNDMKKHCPFKQCIRTITVPYLITTCWFGFEEYIQLKTQSLYHKFYLDHCVFKLGYYPLVREKCEADALCFLKFRPTLTQIKGQSLDELFLQDEEDYFIIFEFLNICLFFTIRHSSPYRHNIKYTKILVYVTDFQ